MPQFVPLCPLKNEKGLRQHPFTINHYSRTTPQLVSMEMILLLEYPSCLCISKRQESCSGRRLGSAAPSTAPALLSLLWTLCWDQPRGNCIPLRQVKQPSCTGSLHQWESPKFLKPYPTTALLEGSTQHLTGMVPHTCPLSHSSEHPCEGTGPALRPGTPHSWQRRRQ